MTDHSRTPTCRLMAHWIAGYPDREGSVEALRALSDGGADYLEIQFPFSDPSADGPAIERACHASLAAGFTTADGFALVSRLAGAGAPPVFVMTYASLVAAWGVERFAETAAASGVAGLVIPDLPEDYDEGLFAAGTRRGLAVVPVLAPGISPERLARVRALKPAYVYTALRSGITGSATRLDDDTLRYLDAVKGVGAKIVAGFGVRTREQMALLSGHAYAAAVGTYFLEAASGAADPPQALRDACARLGVRGTA